MRHERELILQPRTRSQADLEREIWKETLIQEQHSDRRTCWPDGDTDAVRCASERDRRLEQLIPACSSGYATPDDLHERAVPRVLSLEWRSRGNS